MRLLVASEKKGGRKAASVEDPALVAMLEQAVHEDTAGSPVEPDQLWTNRSPTELADELTEQGHPVDPKTVQRMLKDDHRICSHCGNIFRAHKAFAIGVGWPHAFA